MFCVSKWKIQTLWSKVQWRIYAARFTKSYFCQLSGSKLGSYGIWHYTYDLYFVDIRDENINYFMNESKSIQTTCTTLVFSILHTSRLR
jgi:hypothetical protein